MERWLGWAVWVPVTLALAWSGLLLWLVDTVDVYSSISASDDGTMSTSGDTLAETNGSYAYLVACVPLTVSVVVALLAAFRPHLTTAGIAACIVGLLGVLNLLAMLTVGIFVLPATAALVVAVVAMFVRATSASPPSARETDAARV